MFIIAPGQKTFRFSLTQRYVVCSHLFFQICSYRFFSKGRKNEFKTAVVIEPLVFEPLKVYFVSVV